MDSNGRGGLMTGWASWFFRDLPFWTQVETFVSGYFGGSTSWTWRLLKLGAIIVAIFCLTNFALGGERSGSKSARVHFKRRVHKSIKQMRLQDRAIKFMKKGKSKQDRSISKRMTMFMPLPALRRKLDSQDGHSWEDMELRKEACDDVRPLVVFVNSKSGGGQGLEVLEEMRRFLSKVQVVDLKVETPDACLEWWGKTDVQFRVLVCGGDGTVGWVLGVLERLQLKYTPPVAILPLGTGNDLARVMGWGGGFTGGSIEPCLRSVSSAHVALLDRWLVKCRDLVPATPTPARQSIKGRLSIMAGGFVPKKDGPLRRAITKQLTGSLDSAEPNKERKSMVLCNYFGIGVDAAVALDFHNMRERRPDLFVSRAVNKIWYAKAGALSTLDHIRGSASIKEKITLYVNDEDQPTEQDGQIRWKEIKLPGNLEGVIVLNIASFGGGTDLWGHDHAVQEEEEEDSDEDEDESDEDKDESVGKRRSDSCATSAVFARPSMQDRKLEVVGVHGAAQLGAAQVGLYTADRLAQASSVRIVNKVEIAVEVDGEPWVFAKDGEVEINFKSQALMLQTSKESNHGVATDVVDWALQKEVISLEQRDTLMKEIARRVQVHQTEQEQPKISTVRSRVTGKLKSPRQ